MALVRACGQVIAFVGEIMADRVELLAPCGNMDCFYAAVNAGADAVYLAGGKFGARAYADNFTTEQILLAIRYGHLFGIKIYLTLNTLIKEREIKEIIPYVTPFYEAGLDGVIVQDFGVVMILKNCFPDMEIHASTQMTVTGTGGAALLKEYGVKRIVPARELSLSELIKIKEQTGVEIEIFIHGAMCYAYSGQCLFSSVLGGRSGNRGRCAGPCRLPYGIYDGDKKLNPKGQDYPLSLKDLCTISILPELVMAGMDSFKIEGRMKSAEYVAVVTSIYRKYIDFIYTFQKEDGSFDKSLKEKYHVKKHDLELLSQLYVRKNLQDGYFHTHNGAKLVTLDKPGYVSIPDDKLQKIRERYRMDSQKKAVKMEAFLQAGKAAELRVGLPNRQGADNFAHTKDQTQVTVQGETVQNAINRAMTEEDISKQLQKTGNTPFFAESIKLYMDRDIFIPNKSINELRRNALDALMDALTKNGRLAKNADIPEVSFRGKSAERSLTVSVNTVPQLRECLKFDGINAVYVTTDLFFELTGDVAKKTAENELKELQKKQTALYLQLPRVMREAVSEHIRTMFESEGQKMFRGIVTNSLEGLAMFRDTGTKIIGDAGLYTFNRTAALWLMEHGVTYFTLPYECSYHELKEIAGTDCPAQLVIYGYLPLMESAGCVAKTFSACGRKNALYTMTDRYHKRFFVKTHCGRCENTIYNSVPLNLIGEWEKLKELSADHRIDFTVESGKDASKILHDYFQAVRNGQGQKTKTADHTKGYFKRGVE